MCKGEIRVWRFSQPTGECFLLNIMPWGWSYSCRLSFFHLEVSPGEISRSDLPNWVMMTFRCHFLPEGVTLELLLLQVNIGIADQTDSLGSTITLLVKSELPLVVVA
jgi:hypothetical protein